MGFFSKLGDKLKKYLVIPQSPDDISPEKAEKMLDFLAKEIVKRRLETPAILFIETYKPLGVIGSSLGQFFMSPFTDFLSAEKLSEYLVLFETRGNIEKLLQKIEEYGRANK